MPITQDRVIDILDGGNDFYNFYRTVTRIIAKGAEDYRNNPQNLPLVLHSIFHIAQDPAFYLREPTKSPATLERETIHFHRVRVRNEKMKARMAAARTSTRTNEHHLSKAHTFFSDDTRRKQEMENMQYMADNAEAKVYKEKVNCPLCGYPNTRADCPDNPETCPFYRANQ